MEIFTINSKTLLTFSLDLFRFGHAGFKSQWERLWDIYIIGSLSRCSCHYTGNSNGFLLAH